MEYLKSTFDFRRSILNQPEYKLNNVPLKLFPWEDSNKSSHDDKSFRIVQKGKKPDENHLQPKTNSVLGNETVTKLTNSRTDWTAKYLFK